MHLKTTFIAAVLLMLAGFPLTGSARDTASHFNFNSAVEQAVQAGVIDGSVRFYLAGVNVPGSIDRRNETITNQKTNAFGKSDAVACDHVFRSALIQLHRAAKNAGANAVVDIVSFYKRNEYRSSENYECHAGGVLAGVALKGTIATIR